ncbi:MAG TPA: PEP/pyruvate-binding domain-containing protein, partial [Tepidisphaeraceae bacterium]|nr:PEP/pyruvate-binding domain-containing protein [Tepidisphaeraceae bacterium]
MIYIIWPEDSTEHTHLGSKAQTLFELRQLDLPISPWFVIAPEAFYASLNSPQQAAFRQSDDAEEIQQIAQAATLTEPIRADLQRALHRLCPENQLVAVRASALDEEAMNSSSAPQLASFLAVAPAQVAEKVVAVWHSAFTPQILAHRRGQCTSLRPHPPAILIQRMLKADVTGYAFGADPATGRRTVVVISATPTFYDESATYAVDRQGTIVRRPNPTEPAKSGQACLPSLSDDQVRSVATLARKATHHLGRPQEVHWAFEGGTASVLSARPMASIHLLPDPDGVRRIWDESGLAEEYTGLTTPLTFSFARHVHEEIARQFCNGMQVPQETIASHQDTFANLLGLIHGRVYCNWMNWRRVWTL